MHPLKSNLKEVAMILRYSVSKKNFQSRETSLDDVISFSFAVKVLAQVSDNTFWSAYGAFCTCLNETSH